jgi:hypothetical protein
MPIANYGADRSSRKLRSGNCSGSACGSCGSLHLPARFTGYPFRVFDLTLRLLFLLRSRPLNSSPLPCSSVSPRPAALVGPRQYRLGEDRHHTPGRHEALRAVLMSGISYAGPRFWWLRALPFSAVDALFDGFDDSPVLE